jgi:hypothetical protein
MAMNCDCAFCDKKFAEIEWLVIHLIESHPKQGEDGQHFWVDAQSFRVKCVCGKYFNGPAIFVGHAFMDWAILNTVCFGSFCEHLRAQGGLIEHLAALQAEVDIERIGKFAQPSASSCSSSYSPSSYASSSTPAASSSVVPQPRSSPTPKKTLVAPPPIA